MNTTRRAGRSAFTLVELLVVIAIIGTLMGLLLPAVQNARESGRSNQCRSNLTNFQKAMTSYEVANKQYPGYVNAVGIGGKTTASWSAMLLPYLEQTQLWDEFAKGRQAAAQIEFFICPSNPPQMEGAPSMSYLANAGYIQLEKIEAENDDCSMVENPANGIFFDKTRGGADIRDLDPQCEKPQSDAIINMEFASIAARGDGSTHTLMFAEGINAGVWTGVSAPDKKWHYGFCWEDPDILENALSTSESRDLANSAQYRRMNGVRELLPLQNGDKAPNSAFPSSFHSGNINVAYVGGQVLTLAETIDPIVYAQLMTTNRKLSDLEYRGKYDRDMPLPDAADF